MSSHPLHDAVTELAGRTHAFADSDLDQPWTWRAHDEGVRFAFLGTMHELRDLAVRQRHARLAAGQPLTDMQHALAQYHAAYRDLEAVLIGLTEADYDREPAPGEWPLRDVMAHTVGSQRLFFTLIHHGLARHRAGLEPEPLPDDETDRIVGPYDDFRTITRSGTLADMRAFYAALHHRVLAEFVDITDAEGAAITLWWEELPLSLEYRLHRFDAHLRQHTVQAEKTLVQLGAGPTEVKRLLRLVYRALAEVEGFALGADDIGARERQALADAVHARAAEVAVVVEQARAVVATALSGDVPTLSALLAENPKLAGATGADGLSVVMTAIYNGQSDVVAALVDAGADLTIFEGAALGRQDVVGKYFAEWPGYVNERARDGFTPLQLACYFGQESVAEWLLEHNAEVAAVSNNPMRLQALHSAAANGNLTLMSDLLDRGADVNAVQSHGFTVLHTAADSGSEPMAHLLLSRGADATLRSEAGQTPAELAEAKGHSAVAEVLRAGAAAVG